MNIKKRENIDWLLKQIFKGAGLLTIALLGGIFIMLLYNSIAFFINIKPVDFTNLNREQIKRIYKFTDGSGTTCNFIQHYTASLLFDMPKKIQEKLKLNYSIQNEIGLGSPQSKNQNTNDNQVQIKKVCWKLKVDRLGNTSKANL